MKVLLLLCFFILSTFQQKRPEFYNSTPEERGTNASEIQLMGIYATSTQIPASQFGYHHLFDNNPNTYWCTMPGAGPEEGLMLYFRSPQKFSSMEIIQPLMSNHSPIESVVIYINGQRFSEHDISMETIQLNAENVSSLFIKIEGTGHLEEKYDDNTAITNYSFSSNLSIAISEIKFFYQDVQSTIELPKLVQGSMSASSTLAPASSYGIGNLFDSKKEFAWAEGNPNSGEGETLTFTFKDEQNIIGLRIMNGFQRSDKHYKANARAKSILVTNEKKQEHLLNLKDVQGEQFLIFPSPLKSSQLTLTVKEIFPGTSYKDLVLSELKFISSSGSIILEDDNIESRKQELKERSKNTILQNLIDHRVSNMYQEMDGYTRSIILRSDYTFVAYSQEYTELSSGFKTNEIIAEGNWEIKELSAQSAKIRIFGKLSRLSETSNYYTGNSASSFLQIFQDNLSIENGRISGEKFIEELILPN